MPTMTMKTMKTMKTIKPMKSFSKIPVKEKTFSSHPIKKTVIRKF